jgi:hypothetical protein
MARFLLNDASFHGQFGSTAGVILALQRVYDVRKELKRSAFELEVHSRIVERPATPSEDLRTTLFKSSNRDLKNLIFAWFNNAGCFWNNPPKHDPGEYFQCNGAVVTETALGEAAMLHWIEDSTETDTVSLNPSNFDADPLRVDWLERKGVNLEFAIRNHIACSSLPARLSALEKPAQNWDQLVGMLEKKCPSLLLSDEIVNQLGSCFYPNVAKQSIVLLQNLNAMITAKRAGNESLFNDLRSKWMVGDEARFTDSSDSEKKDFAAKMWFKHSMTGQSIFCSWHGKIQTPLFRIHFEWPMPKGVYQKEKETDEFQKLFIAYIGPKLTKK